MAVEELTSFWTYFVTYSTLIYCLATVIISIVILIVLRREKTYADNAFFSIYQVALLSDIASIFFNHIFAVFPSLGWFNEFYSTHEIVLPLFLFSSYFTRTVEGFSNMALCVNRATAIIFPLSHSTIWNRRNLSIVILAELILGFVTGATSSMFTAYWRRYPGNRLFPVNVETEQLKMFWLQSFLLLSFCVAMLCLLYLIIIIKFKAQLKEYRSLSSAYNAQSKSRNNKQAAPLLYISVAVISTEIAYACFFYYYFVGYIQFGVDCRIFFSILIVTTDFYSSIPCLLLLIFCSSVRKDVHNLLRNIWRRSTTSSSAVHSLNSIKSNPEHP